MCCDNLKIAKICLAIKLRQVVEVWIVFVNFAYFSTCYKCI